MAEDTKPLSSVRRFALLCVIVGIGVAAFAVYSHRRQMGGGDGPVAPVDPAAVAEIRRQPHLLFRITALGASYGRVGLVSLARPTAPPLVSDLRCDRVHASARQGLCLQAARGVLTTYRAIAFDAHLVRQFDFPLQGAPSRTRVSAVSPMGASTVFVSGDSYAGGAFSTRTTLYDLGSNAMVGELESFTVRKDGQPFKQQDFNFWGVTFADDGDRFYATLGTGGALLLVEGSIRHRAMSVVGSDVECPMLSPDGTRLVFKRRIFEGGRLTWRLRVLDLRSRSMTDLQEMRNVDDQAEWLDDRHILYGLPRQGTGSSDVWSVPSDGSGAPELLVRDASSPAVVRVP